MDESIEIQTKLEDVCSGGHPGEIYMICHNHEAEEYADSVVSILLKATIDTNGLNTEVIFNSLDHPSTNSYTSTFTCLDRCHDGTVYIGDYGGIYEYKTGKIQYTNIQPSAKNPPTTQNCIYARGGNQVAFGTSGWGILYIDTGKFTATSISSITPTSGHIGINRIHGVGADFMVVAGANGFVAKYKNGQWAQAKGPSNTDLYGVCCSNESEIYIAGRNSLAWRWDGDGRWKQLKVEFDGDPDDLTFCDLAEYDGVIYAAGAEHGIYRLEGDKFVPVPKVANEFVRRLRATTSGLIGLGGVWDEEGNWFTRFDGKTWTAEQVNIKLP